MNNKDYDPFNFSVDGFTNNLSMSTLNINMNSNIPDLKIPELKNCDEFLKEYEEEKKKWKDEQYTLFMKLANEMFDMSVTNLNRRIELCFDKNCDVYSPVEKTPISVISLEKLLTTQTEREVAKFVANKLRDYYKSHNYWCTVDINPLPVGGRITDGTVDYLMKIQVFIDNTYAEYERREKEQVEKMRMIEERRSNLCP